MSAKVIYGSVEAQRTAIAENLRLLHAKLSDAAQSSKSALSFIQNRERNGAIGSVAGLDVELDEAKALYRAALALNVSMNRKG